MPFQTSAESLNYPLQSHPAKALAISKPHFGWDQAGWMLFFLFCFCCWFVVIIFQNQIHVNIFLGLCFIAFLSSVPFPTKSLLIYILFTCRFVHPGKADQSSSQSTLLPPAADFPEVCRDVRYFSTAWFAGPISVHISVA